MKLGSQVSQEESVDKVKGRETKDAAGGSILVDITGAVYIGTHGDLPVGVSSPWGQSRS